MFKLLMAMTLALTVLPNTTSGSDGTRMCFPLKVYDASNRDNGAPIKGARIIIAGKTIGRTNEYGMLPVCIRLPVKPPKIVVCAEAPGYSTNCPPLGADNAERGVIRIGMTRNTR